MTDSFHHIETAAMQLTAQERAELAERLLATLLPATPLHAAWDAEIAQRIGDLDSGRTTRLSGETVMAEMRAMIESDKSDA